MSAVVDAVASSSVYCAHAEPVPLPALRLFTVAVATWDQKTREGMILLVNRDEHNAHDVTIDLTSLPRLGEWPAVTSSQMLLSDDIYRTNTADEPDGVTLQPLSAALDEGRRLFRCHRSHGLRGGSRPDYRELTLSNSQIQG